MALTNDNSKREMFFDGGMPVRDGSKYESLKRILQEAQHPTAVSLDMISQIFSPLKDAWTCLVISSSSQQFERWCKSHGWSCVFDNNMHMYIVKK
jgi:hypothetical protein